MAATRSILAGYCGVSNTRTPRERSGDADVNGGARAHRIAASHRLPDERADLRRQEAAGPELNDRRQRRILRAQGCL
jgi:hypothetical protein